MQLENSRLNEQDKCDYSDQHAENVSSVVSVVDDVACAATVNAAVLLWFEGARKRRGHEGVFESFSWRWGGGRDTGGFGEEVHEAKDEVARECAAQVGDAGRC